MSSSSTKVTLKLLVDTKKNKVLFAEASNMFRHRFSLKHVSIVFWYCCKAHEQQRHALFVWQLRKSVSYYSTTVQNLNQNYVLFDPTIPNDDHNLETSFHMCPNGCTYGITSCDQCSRPMNRDQTRHVAMKDQNVTFMLMDDLVIQPFSPISIITLLNKLNFKQVHNCQEMVVEFGMDECELLKTSLQSKMVLTSVFIKNENKKELSKLRRIWYFPFVVLGYIVYFDCLLHSKTSTSVTSLLVASLQLKVGLAIDFMRNNIWDPKE